MNLRICVIGTGYLGACHACCLAELGFDVLGVDADDAKVRRLARGLPTFYEPRFGELLRRHTSSGRLRFTTSLAEAAEFGEVLFLCVGTPPRAEGWAADTSSLMSVVEQIVPRLRQDVLVVGKSTVPVGTGARVAARTAELAPLGVSVEVAWNPEFLREGHAVQDTLRPARLVVGVSSAHAENVLRQVYARLLDDGVPIVVTDVATAELVKVSANAFLATKISFINAVAELCETAGGDVLALSRALGYDERIGPGALHPGAGYGGGCLPKDLRAMIARAGELGADQTMTLLWDVDVVNTRLRRRIVALAAEECGGSLRGRRVGILGAAFKPFTDDVRDSPALEIAAELHTAGALVRVYDPQANANAAAMQPSLHFVRSPLAAATGADLLMHLTEWPEFARIEPASLLPYVRRPRLLDGRNTLDAGRWQQAGWSYRALGRPRLYHRTRALKVNGNEVSCHRERMGT